MHVVSWGGGGEKGEEGGGIILRFPLDKHPPNQPPWAAELLEAKSQQ